MRWIKPTGRYRDMFDGNRVLRIDEGQHHIVAAKRGRPKGAILAREVILGGGVAECSGMVSVVVVGGFLRAKFKTHVDAWAGTVEADCAEVLVTGNPYVIARRSTTVYVQAGRPIIDAFDDALVVLCGVEGITINLHDRAQLVRWRPVVDRVAAASGRIALAA